MDNTEYVKERDRRHEEFMREHTKKVRDLDNLQVLHEVMNRYAELSNGWTRESLIVEKEMNVSKNEVLRRMKRKNYWPAVAIVSIVINIVFILLGTIG